MSSTPAATEPGLTPVSATESAADARAVEQARALKSVYVYEAPVRLWP